MSSRAVRAPKRPVTASEASDRAPIRLAVARGALGLEVYEAVEVGPLKVHGLTISLPGLAFPVDLSGGVPVFRHRRGEFECAELELGMADLERWTRTSLGHALGVSEPVRATFWALPGGIGVGVAHGTRALAFDVLWAPMDDHARLVVSDERGVGLGTPPLGPALRVMDSLLGRVAVRRGRVFEVEDVAHQLARAILPALGVRAASAIGVRLGGLEAETDRFRVRLDQRLPPPANGARVIRALEVAELASDADDQQAAGNIDSARQSYMEALERAPRHPVLARQVAEIDAWVEGRQEAALGLVVETGPVAECGVVGVELLAHSGDVSGALGAAEALATAEVYAPLASLMWLRLAELTLETGERFRALDQAVARWPGQASARWARLTARLGRGDVQGAMSDVEHLEAAAIGALARNTVCLHAGRRLLEAGFLKEAGKVFERALRYCPDDAEATWGLAKAFSDAGRGTRAAALLERAIELGEAQDRVPPGALLDLARVLSELGDIPAAIARLRQVPARVPEELEARGVEARLRAKLGDLAGASLAFARLRDLVELEPSVDARSAASWLSEAARFEQDRQGDVMAAERHLAIALRRAPHDVEVATAYREVAAEVARLERARQAALRQLSQTSYQPTALAEPPALEPEPERADTQAPPSDPAELHAKVERLRSRLEADPDDDATALELAIALERLERDLELFALLSARIEDVGPSEVDALRPLLIGVLMRLRDSALAEGRQGEAELYAMQLGRWSTR
ncbi:MAG: tetratricopeptide repeat protein [Polyangiaceae bacterium]|nr:tetratricopeptide repeat protein [Polyangiaceae bacterium]